MRRSTLLIFLVVMGSLGVCSCTKTTNDNPNPEQDKVLSVASARAYFEHQPTKSSSPDSYSIFALGSLTPNWSTATDSQWDSVGIVNVLFYKSDDIYAHYPDGRKAKVYQNLRIVRGPLRSGALGLGAFIVTLIPTADFAATHPDGVVEAFNNCDDKGGFSGIAIYSNLNGYQVLINTYKVGVQLNCVRLDEPDAEKLAKRIAWAKGLVAGIQLFKTIPKTKDKDEPAWTMCCLCGKVVVLPHDCGGDMTDNSGQKPAVDTEVPFPDTPGNGGGEESGGGEGNGSGTTTTTTPPPINPPTDPKTIKKITYSIDLYPGYVKGVRDCKAVSDRIMKQILGENANVGKPADAVQLWKEINGEMKLVGNATTVLNIIIDHIESNRPIEVGIDYYPGHPGNLDQTTDHWVVIYGKGFDAAKGQYYFNYIETAYGLMSAEKAISEQLKLYYDDKKNQFTHENAYRKRNYSITQIRPNK